MALIGFGLHHPPPCLSRLLHTQNSVCSFNCSSISISNHGFFILHISRSRHWDSNAESYNTNNFNFDANEETEDFDDDMEQWVEALDDYIDSIWILKVFGSFGWTLPPILLSMLFATGPKAFLMALALPLGQSTFAFAIERFQKRGKIKPKDKNKSKKRRSRSRNVEFEEAPEWIRNRGVRKKKEGYQSWVSQDDISVSSNDRSAYNFGGWDELDSSGMDSSVRSSRRASKKSSRLRGRHAQKGTKTTWSNSDGPLLLRLLVSIFPFLSSFL